MRSGAQTLSMLAAPLTPLVLRSLAGGPKPLTELRREIGSPALSTTRSQLRRLVKLAVIDKHRRESFPGTLEYALADDGRELLAVAEALERWLALSPGGGLPLGGSAAKAATNALAEGWSTTIRRALAAAPLSLTELDGIIAGLSYPAIERRLSAMRLAGQIAARPGQSPGTPYAVTDWLRRGVAPLVVAARWERRFRPGATAFARLDAETAFLLAVPLLRLPGELSGTCRMAMEAANGAGGRLGGVAVTVERGNVVSCTTRIERDAEAWALGSPAAWLAGVVERDLDSLELGGNGAFARLMIDRLHQALFDGAEPRPLDAASLISEDRSN